MVFCGRFGALGGSGTHTAARPTYHAAPETQTLRNPKKTLADALSDTAPRINEGEDMRGPGRSERGRGEVFRNPTGAAAAHSYGDLPRPRTKANGAD